MNKSIKPLLEFMGDFDSFEELTSSEAPKHLQDLTYKLFGHLPKNEAEKELKALWLLSQGLII